MLWLEESRRYFKTSHFCHLFLTTNLWGSIESLCCIPETNTLLQINHTSTKNWKKKNTGFTCPQWKLSQALVSPSRATGQEQDHVSVLFHLLLDPLLIPSHPRGWLPGPYAFSTPSTTSQRDTMSAQSHCAYEDNELLTFCWGQARGGGGSQPQGAEVIPPSSSLRKGHTLSACRDLDWY